MNTTWKLHLKERISFGPLPEHFLLPLFLLLTFLPVGQLHAQCDLYCDDGVNVSLDQDGIAVILPDVILEDSSNCPGPKIVEVLAGPGGSSIGDTVRCIHHNRTLTVRVRDLLSSNSCTGTIRVRDTRGPLINCRDTIVPCGTIVHPDTFGFPQIEDNCDPHPDIFFSDQVENLQCAGGPYVAILRRTWGARDLYNNRSTPCTQQIFLRSGNLSDVEFPGNRDGIFLPALPCTIPGPDPALTGQPMIDSVPVQGYCKFVVSYKDTRLDLCAGSYKILREWLVVDCCTSDDTSALQIIKVMDQSPPQLTCPSDTVVGADLDDCVGSFLLGPASVTDDCSNSFNTWFEINGERINSNGGQVTDLPLGTHTATFFATDNCGNTGTCNMEIEVTDDVPPVPVCTEFLVVNIPSSGLACVPAESFDAGSYDNCCIDSIRVRRMDEPDSLYAEEVCFDCSDAGSSVTVVVNFWDCHQNENQCMPVIRVRDKITPKITCPPTDTLLCTQDATDTSLVARPSVTDNCNTVSWQYNDSLALTTCNTGKVYRQWIATDGAGLSDTCIQVICLVDTTQAVFRFPADTSLACDEPLDSLDLGRPEIIDDCGDYAINTRDSIFYGNCFLKIFRIFKIKNCCTDEDTVHIQQISLLDTLPPVWDQAPGSLDTLLGCGDQIPNLPAPTATDGCPGLVRVDLVRDTLIPGNCPNRFERIWDYVATDTCGNESPVFRVRARVDDTEPPSFSGIPADTTLDCSMSYTPPMVMATDNCDPAPVLNIRTDSVVVFCPNVLRIRYTWTATDNCGNNSSISRTVTFIDTIPPVADPIPDSTIFCLEDLPAPDSSILTGLSDNCSDTVTVEVLRDAVNDMCNDTLTHVYRLRDNCGNIRDIPQRIIIRDTIPPRLQCPGDRTVIIDPDTVTCTGFVDSLTAIAFDNCMNTLVTVTNDSPFADTTNMDASGDYPLGRHLITFEAEDACGNIETCQTTIEVRDTLAPNLSCRDTLTVSLNSNRMVTLEPDSLVISSGTFDHCSDITIAANPLVFNCDSLGQRSVTVTATDTFGNMAVCTVLVNVTDPQRFCGTPFSPGLIAGRLATDSGIEIPNTLINLVDPFSHRTTLTNPNGWYVFQDVPFGASCSVIPYRNDDPLNGVSTFDLVLISRHIINSDPIRHPCRLIAADVNRSGSITVSDLMELRKLILGKENTFQSNLSWRFIDRSYFDRPAIHPLHDQLPERIEITNFSNSRIDLDFTAIKVGDINGNARPVETLPEDRHLEQEIWVTPESAIEEGAILRIPISRNATESLTGFQFTLAYQQESVEFLGIEAGSCRDFGQDHFHHLPEKSLVTVSWNGDMQSADEPMFFLLARGKKVGRLSECLFFIPESISPEAYTKALEIRRLKLEFDRGEPGNGLELLDAQPNPFRTETRIGFRIGIPCPVTLELIDLAGRIVLRKQGDYPAGTHQVRIRKRDLPESGLYFYRLKTPIGVRTKRLMLNH